MEQHSTGHNQWPVSVLLRSSISVFEELVLERALGWSQRRLASLREPRIAAGDTSEPRMVAGLGEPQTAALISPDGCMVEGAVDDSEIVPSSLVLWCLGGPRGDGSWPCVRKARGWWRHRMLSPW